MYYCFSIIPTESHFLSRIKISMFNALWIANRGKKINVLTVRFAAKKVKTH